MPTAQNVAEFFLTLSDPDVGDTISNLKVQKLVYYAQGFSLAMHGSKIFDEPILAWEHGPVVESLYKTYRVHEARALPMPEGFVANNLFAPEQIELLKEVYEVYGQFSAWKLRNMTHSEAPWVNTPRNQEISTELMKDFFKGYITE